MNLNTPIKEISGIGKAISSRLKKININKINDIIFHFPFRYKDFTKTTKIKDIIANTETNIIGYIELIQNKRSKTKKMSITEALISDGSGEIKVIWFNQPFITKNIKVGDKISLSGKIKNNFGENTMMSPNYEKIFSNNNTINTQGLIPQYHTTEKLTQKQIRTLINQVISLIKNIDDWMPIEIKKKLNLINLNDALTQIHFPKNTQSIKLAKNRLAFDELFLLQLKSQLIKKDIKSKKSQKINFKQKETKDFVNSLPFKLTNTQKKSTWEILQDMEKNKPMSRLLEGDVGSGKTLVAVIAMLNTSLNKKFTQSVLMVPTEILAEQHFNSISQILKKVKCSMNIKIGLLTKNKQKINFKSKIFEKSKKKELSNFITKKCKIIIGTHSIIQDKIKFKNLALVIIDEQHRFGVEQRKTLMKKSGNLKTTPHLLSMTATPIPRTLALALFGELDISIINELPTDRKKIITKVVPKEKRQDAYNFISEEINKKKQIFVICPLVDPSDKLELKSVSEEYQRLKHKIFPKKKIQMIHGKLKSKEKETIMQDFMDRKFDILVSTSVVEVGVDIPNATVIIIEGAERFGLAQLHQFRGRVGRNNFQSYCLLFTTTSDKEQSQRLKAMEKFNNGFELAKIDLKLRGSGDFYGTAQKGFPELKIANLLDYNLMNQAKIEAEKLINKDSNLKNYPILKEKYKNWKDKIHLE